MTTRDIELKQSIKEWTEEVTKENPEWVKERRTDYLIGQILKRFDDIDWWRDRAKWANSAKGEWWCDSIHDEVIRPIEKEIQRMIAEIRLYDNPQLKNYNRIDFDQLKDEAKRVPLDEVSGLEFRTAGSNRKIARCPFHTERTASFVWYVDQNSYHCFGCGEGGDSISYVMKINNIPFKEAVKTLAR